MRAELESEAAAIGFRLCRDALWSGRHVTWLGDRTAGSPGAWTQVHGTVGPDLYGGDAGIALFLALLDQRRPERCFRSTAVAAIRHAIDGVTRRPVAGNGGGFYSGPVGVAWAAAETADLLADDDCMHLAYELSCALTSPPFAGEADLIAGHAGFALGMSLLARRFSDGLLAQKALDGAAALMCRARHSERGAYWERTGEPGSPGLTGIAHGAAGVAWALAETGSHLDERRFIDLALEAHRYEQSWFDAEASNWADLRDIGARDQRRYAFAWCHGSAGIGLSRLRLRGQLDDETYRRELTAAIGTTTSALGHELPDMSLCHGRFGQTEFLLEAALCEPGTATMDTVHAVVGSAFASFGEAKSDWPCGIRDGYSPSLMLGLAGIGYHLLRVAEAERVPVVLAPRAV